MFWRGRRANEYEMALFSEENTTESENISNSARSIKVSNQHMIVCLLNYLLSNHILHSPNLVLIVYKFKMSIMLSVVVITKSQTIDFLNYSLFHLELMSEDFHKFLQEKHSILRLVNPILIISHHFVQHHICHSILLSGL